MRTSFKVHAALAGGLSALMLLAAALTLLPGRLPLPSPRTLTAVDFAVLFPLLGAAVLRGMAYGADRVNPWPAFRCLPGRVQVATGVLVGAGIAMSVAAFATEHTAAPESLQRFALALPGTVLAGAAVLMLICGELRRADDAVAADARTAADS